MSVKNKLSTGRDERVLCAANFNCVVALHSGENFLRKFLIFVLWKELKKEKINSQSC
jgi:hypothetical protein